MLQLHRYSTYRYSTVHYCSVMYYCTAHVLLCSIEYPNTVGCTDTVLDKCRYSTVPVQYSTGTGTAVLYCTVLYCIVQYCTCTVWLQPYNTCNSTCMIPVVTVSVLYCTRIIYMIQYRCSSVISSAQDMYCTLYSNII